jgi:hypothetical protein
MGLRELLWDLWAALGTSDGHLPTAVKGQVPQKETSFLTN